MEFMLLGHMIITIKFIQLRRKNFKRLKFFLSWNYFSRPQCDGGGDDTVVKNCNKQANNGSIVFGHIDRLPRSERFWLTHNFDIFEAFICRRLRCATSGVHIINM